MPSCHGPRFGRHPVRATRTASSCRASSQLSKSKVCGRAPSVRQAHPPGHVGFFDLGAYRPESLWRVPDDFVEEPLRADHRKHAHCAPYGQADGNHRALAGQLAPSAL